jgi:hypothetical protein
MVGRVIANSSLGLPSPCGVVPQVPILVKRTITTDEKIMSREVVVEKTTNGKESLKITIKAPTLGGVGPSQDCKGYGMATQSSTTGWTSSHYRSDRFSHEAPNVTGQTSSPYWPDRPSSPWMTENFQAQESREGVVEDR